MDIENLQAPHFGERFELETSKEAALDYQLRRAQVRVQNAERKIRNTEDALSAFHYRMETELKKEKPDIRILLLNFEALFPEAMR